MGKVNHKVDMPNVILITIDCLRFDHLGCYGYSRDITPNIDNLAARGATFLQAISNGGQTPFAFPPIMASALPPLENAEDKEIMRRSTTLAEVLKEAGYHTAGFHSNPYLSRFFNYDKGFDIFKDNLSKASALRRQKIRDGFGMRLQPLKEFKFGRSAVDFLARLWRLFNAAGFSMRGTDIIRAEELTGQVIEQLGAGEGKFFLWLHYMDAHAPYMPSTKYLVQLHNQPVGRRQMAGLYYKMNHRPGQLSPSEVATLADLYDAQVKYVDDVIGQLLNNLGSDLANTIVIVTADHGDEFGEHGRFEHLTLYDEIIHVPLIIAGPGINGSTVVKRQVSLLDLAPTVVSLARIESVRGFCGERLLPAIRGEGGRTRGVISTLIEPAQRMIAYRIPGWKYIRTESLDASKTVLAEELYDLTGDPGETKNLHGVNNGKAKSFEFEARNRVAQFKRLKVKERTAYEKKKVKARLKKLQGE